jgi:long-chain acyl-CoA synthetase
MQAEMNLADLVRDAAADFPAKPALIFQGRPITFSELDDRVDLTAAAFASLGVTKGDRVALIAGNVPEFIDALYGALRAGAAVSPLNVMLTPEELGYILADAGTKLAVTELAYLPGLLAVRDRLADLETIVVIGGPPAPSGTVSLEEALTHAGDPPEVSTGAGDVAVVAYTAGTTASPKGAMLTHANLIANLDQIMSVPALAEAVDDVVLLALPLFHIYALNVVLGLCLRTGATAVLVERFDPAESASLVARHGVSVLFGAPPMFAAWLALPRSGPDGEVADALGRVRLAASGAAPLPPAVLEGFQERFGVTIWEGYGLTESAPAVTTNALGPVAKGGSIGLPLPGVEVRLVDEFADELEDVEDGDPGEIVVRGPNVFGGYWNRPEETAAVLAGDWLRTGDIAYRDEDGYLFLVDRKKDLINVSGFNVFPKEVEEAVATHPAVEEVAVVGIPDDHTGEAVEAWVVPKEGRSVTEEAVLDHLRGYIARFKMPKVVKVVDELPHHVTGKVLRRALRAPEPIPDLTTDEVASE